MQPTGAKNPIVYMLGEAPGETEDIKNRQFVGKTGRILRARITNDWDPHLRWNNCVRTRPPKNRDPSQVEIESCRPSIIADIEKSKPKAIFGFGNVPLHWALKETGISKWRGKRVPIKVGNHSCWFYPMFHPSYIMRRQHWAKSDDEMIFELDLKRAFAEVENLPNAVVHTKEDALENVEVIDGSNRGDFHRVMDLFKEMWNEKLIGYDYETDQLRPYGKGARILTWAMANKDHSTAVALDHREAGWNGPDRLGIKEQLQQFLYEAPCRKVAFNLPFEMEWSAVLFGLGVAWGSKWADGMLQAYVLNPLRADRRLGDLSLESLVLEHFGINIKEFAGVNRKKMADEPLAKILPYNAVDAKYHRLLYLAQRPQLEKAKLQRIYQQQLRRIPTMVLTQIKGVPIDHAVVDEFDQQYTKRVNRRLAEMRMLPCVRKFKKAIGHEFNPGSNPDVKKLITKVLGIPLEKGADEDALAQIKDPFAPALLKWRKATKLRSTYVLSADAGRIWPDGLLHPILNTMRVVTSRTSSDSPNIQNFPKRGPSKIVRKQVKPGPEEVVVAIDYAGIQARNVAMESNDTKLVKAFWNHYDIHGDFTERLIRIYPDFIEEGAKEAARNKDLFKAYRNRVKNEFVFPSFFGATAKSVAGYLAIPERVGEKLQEQFWGDFKDVPAWHKRVRKHYDKHGWIMGLSGFRHPAPIAWTELINYPIQADEAAIVCEAQGQLSKKGDDLLQANLMVHDDLTFILPKKKVDEYISLILEEMLRINFDWVNVPLEAEVSIGPDWYDLKEIGKYESMIKGGYRQL